MFMCGEKGVCVGSMSTLHLFLHIPVARSGSAAFFGWGFY